MSEYCFWCGHERDEHNFKNGLLKACLAAGDCACPGFRSEPAHMLSLRMRLIELENWAATLGYHIPPNLDALKGTGR